jgi:hypothetical protein
MSSEAGTPEGAALRKARVAVAALFFTNGALFANLLPRYPQIKDALELNTTTVEGLESRLNDHIASGGHLSH